MFKGTAPAKINLYLHITGRREDGYHFLSSLITLTDICDEITITPAQAFSLNITGEFAANIPNDATNIIARATSLMAQACNKKNNVAINLVKNIPHGAGLGGGSSDAATTINILNEMWQANLSPAKRTEIALELGADVPFFINRQAAFISGIGEQISFANNMPKFYAILLYPNQPLATKTVFQSHILNTNIIKNPTPLAPSNKNEAEWLGFLQQNGNDLTQAATTLLPEITSILNTMNNLPGCHFARMSGSGSSCFAIFTQASKATEATKLLQQHYTTAWVKFTRLT